MLKKYKDIISGESSTFLEKLSNLEFNQITSFSSVGHYQYHKANQYFSFREQAKIHELKKLSLEDFLCCLESKIFEYLDASNIEISFKEGMFLISFTKNSGGKYNYQKRQKQLFPILMDLYAYAKNEYLSQKEAS